MTIKAVKTVKQFCQDNPAFPIGGMRDKIFKQDTNGLKGAFPKLGRRVYVDEERFFQALENINQEKAA
jgi:hypothetical protein